MNWKQGLKLVGNVAGTVNPAVGAAILAINAFLPDNKKLPETSTATDAIAAYESLPLEKRAAIDSQLDHELGMEEQRTAQLKAAWEHDGVGSSTRPEIALQSLRMVSFITLAYIVQSFHGGHVFTWQEIVAMTSPFALWVGHYMGLRTKEKIARSNVASGHPALGAVTSLISAWKSK